MHVEACKLLHAVPDRTIPVLRNYILVTTILIPNCVIQFQPLVRG